MTDPQLHKPTLDFLLAMSEAVTNDAETVELMDGIAATIGDMLGYQTQYREPTMRFIARLIAAAEAAHKRRFAAMQ